MSEREKTTEINISRTLDPKPIIIIAGLANAGLVMVDTKFGIQMVPITVGLSALILAIDYTIKRYIRDGNGKK